MTSLKNDLLLRCLAGQRVERPPVWMMRQAGRYLPDYRKLRDRYSFFERVQTPALACEITLQPVDQIGVDAAILFSDILVVAQAMGLEVQLVENKGPYLPDPVKSEKDLQRLQVADPRERLSYVLDAIALTKKSLAGKVPLIGFAGAPWTMLCYMVQGQGSKSFDEAKAFCFSQPGLAARLLDMITDTTIAYLKAQVASGVDALQVFDSWGGLLSPDDFQVWSLPYLKKIAQALSPSAPLILFAKGAWFALSELAATGAQGLGIDWCIRPALARQLAGDQVVLQGNFDPAKLLAPPADLKKAVRQMLSDFDNHRHIANLGHGILPNVPVDHARIFVDTVKEYIPKPGHPSNAPAYHGNPL